MPAKPGALHRDRATLVDRPQRLGILPTWAFWRDSSNWALVQPGFVVLGVFAVLAVAITTPPLLLAAVLPVLTVTLSLGLFERYIRRRALERRALAEPGEQPLALEQ